jgi:hypothetical protein
MINLNFLLFKFNFFNIYLKSNGFIQTDFSNESRTFIWFKLNYFQVSLIFLCCLKDEIINYILIKEVNYRERRRILFNLVKYLFASNKSIF